MLRLAQAASSEYFSAYGTPPNQRRTGVTKTNPGGNMDGELNVVPFYGGWQFVFRAKSDKVAERIAWLMEGAVANGSYIGYGQASLAEDGGKYPREGVFDALFQMTDPDTRKINTLANCDCSSLVGACVYGCGKLEPRLYVPELRTMWTGTEREILMNTGEFVELKDPLLLELGTGLKRGDILLKEGHTAVAIDTDDHLDLVPYKIKNCAQCNVRTGPGTEFEVLHTLNNGDIVYVVSTADNGWKRIFEANGYGYVSGKYCQKPLPEGKATGDVWLRAAAGVSNAGIIVIPVGASVYLTGGTQRVGITIWYECIYGGHRGWASGKYIKP